jgi:hypothetical protein
VTLDEAAQTATIVAAVIAAISFPLIILQLWVAQRQLRDAADLSGSQVLLAVDVVLAGYQEITDRLGSGGVWERSHEHPRTDEEWSLALPYVGTFERLWIAYTLSQVGLKDLDHLYRYRIEHIWRNKSIAQRLYQNRNDWWMFHAPTNRLEDYREKKFPNREERWDPPQTKSRGLSWFSRRRLHVGRA